MADPGFGLDLFLSWPEMSVEELSRALQTSQALEAKTQPSNTQPSWEGDKELPAFVNNMTEDIQQSDAGPSLPPHPAVTGLELPASNRHSSSTKVKRIRSKSSTPKAMPKGKRGQPDRDGENVMALKENLGGNQHSMCDPGTVVLKEKTGVVGRQAVASVTGRGPLSVQQPVASVRIPLSVQQSVAQTPGPWSVLFPGTSMGTFSGQHSKDQLCSPIFPSLPQTDSIDQTHMKSFAAFSSDDEKTVDFCDLRSQKSGGSPFQMFHSPVAASTPTSQEPTGSQTKRTLREHLHAKQLSRSCQSKGAQPFSEFTFSSGQMSEDSGVFMSPSTASASIDPSISIPITLSSENLSLKSAAASSQPVFVQTSGSSKQEPTYTNYIGENASQLPGRNTLSEIGTRDSGLKQSHVLDDWGLEKDSTTTCNSWATEDSNQTLELPLDTPQKEDSSNSQDDRALDTSLTGMCWLSSVSGVTNSLTSPPSVSQSPAQAEKRYSRSRCECNSLEHQPRKPVQKYRDLILSALMSRYDYTMTVKQIQIWLIENVPFFAFHHGCTFWKNAIRHNLSSYDCFVKCKGRKHAWTVDATSINDIDDFMPYGNSSRDLQTSVSVGAGSNVVRLLPKLQPTQIICTSSNQAGTTISPTGLMSILPCNPQPNQYTVVSIPARQVLIQLPSWDSASIQAPKSLIANVILPQMPTPSVSYTSAAVPASRNRKRSSEKQPCRSLQARQVKRMKGSESVQLSSKLSDVLLQAAVQAGLTAETDFLGNAEPPENLQTLFPLTPSNEQADRKEQVSSTTLLGTMPETRFRQPEASDTTISQLTATVELLPPDINSPNKICSDRAHSPEILVRKSGTLMSPSHASPAKGLVTFLLQGESNPMMPQCVMESPPAGSGETMETSTPMNKISIGLEPQASPIEDYLLNDFNSLLASINMSHTLSKTAERDKMSLTEQTSTGQKDQSSLTQQTSTGQKDQSSLTQQASTGQKDQSGVLVSPPLCGVNAELWSSGVDMSLDLGMQSFGNLFELPDHWSLMDQSLEAGKNFVSQDSSAVMDLSGEASRTVTSQAEAFSSSQCNETESNTGMLGSSSSQHACSRESSSKEGGQVALTTLSHTSATQTSSVQAASDLSQQRQCHTAQAACTYGQVRKHAVDREVSCQDNSPPRRSVPLARDQCQSVGQYKRLVHSRPVVTASAGQVTHGQKGHNSSQPCCHSEDCRKAAGSGWAGRGRASWSGKSRRSLKSAFDQQDKANQDSLQDMSRPIQQQETESRHDQVTQSVSLAQDEWCHSDSLSVDQYQMADRVQTSHRDDEDTGFQPLASGVSSKGDATFNTTGHIQRNQIRDVDRQVSVHPQRKSPQLNFHDSFMKYQERASVHPASRQPHMPLQGPHHRDDLFDQHSPQLPQSGPSPYSQQEQAEQGEMTFQSLQPASQGHQSLAQNDQLSSRSQHFSQASTGQPNQQKLLTFKGQKNYASLKSELDQQLHQVCNELLHHQTYPPSTSHVSALTHAGATDTQPSSQMFPTQHGAGTQVRPSLQARDHPAEAIADVANKKCQTSSTLPSSLKKTGTSVKDSVLTCSQSLPVSASSKR